MSTEEPEDVRDEGEASAQDAEAALELDVEQLIVEREKLREVAQRVQADFENYRKRMLREQTEVVERANEQLLQQLLPVLDSFELALGTVADADEQTRKGVELVYAELLNVLERAGLERVPTDGADFDPNVHEAVMQEGDGEHAVVADAMRTGYLLKGRLLRPAMVKVERKD
jgi:molecular chaperone GrpE